ncbi:MAG TPA: hypothetical protein DCM08_13165 [Microscillaceae bacterium]|jgi:hypothetical protein|nr:hypothetical protein [Microscillaceae bacterium]
MYQPPPLDAFELFNQVHPLTYQAYFVEFYADCPFTDAYLFQITWNQQEAIGHKTTWLKNQPTYTLCEESGSLSIASVERLRSLWQSLALAPQFDFGQAGRDGHLFRLVIGHRDTSVSYQWYEVMIPDAWEELAVVSRALQSLATEWQGRQKDFYRFTYTEEATVTSDRCGYWEKTHLKTLA